jgi:hypothetical protein
MEYKDESKTFIYDYSSNGQLKKFLILVTTAILNGGRVCRAQIWKGPTQEPSLPGLV